MNGMDNIKLAPHNDTIYKNIKNIFVNSSFCFLLQVDYTGRYDVVLKVINNFDSDRVKCFVLDNDDRLKNKVNSTNIKNVQFINYEEFLNMSRDEITLMNMDLGVFDSGDFIFFPEISSRIKLLVDSHPGVKILGLSNVFLDSDFEVRGFSSNIVKYNLVDALVNKNFVFPRYVSAISDLSTWFFDLYEKVSKRAVYSEQYNNYLAILEDVKNKIFDNNFYDCIKIILNEKGKYIALSKKEDVGFLKEDFVKNLGDIKGLNVYGEEDLDKFSCDEGLSILVTCNDYRGFDLDGIILGSNFSNFFEKLTFVLSFYKDVIDDDFVILDLYNNIKEIKYLLDSIKEDKFKYEIINKDIIDLLDYVETFYSNKRLGYNEKCFEFFEIVSNSDFSNLDNLCFSDGNNMNDWWICNKKKVLKDKNLICKKISKAYKNRKMLNFDDRKREFLDYILSNNVPNMKDDVCFSDGVNMGAWWIKNKTVIGALDDDVSLDINNII